MANPNIAGSATTIYGNTTYVTPGSTAATVLLSNAAASSSVMKVNQIVAANVNGTSAVTTTVTVNSVAAGGGTAYPIASAISVPPNASIVIVDKTTGLYLMEDKSIVVTSGTSSGITYTISYELIS
jgi:hypothetical protein